MKGKVCLVTGATSGIGFETALGLARLGATVVVTARDAERGKTVCAELRRASDHSKIELVILDLSSQASIRAAAADILARFPRIDVLINNAGVSLFTRQLTLEGYEAHFATNHLGPFLFTTLLLDRLKESAPSRIVNVASSAVAKPDLNDLMSEKSFVPLQVYSQTKAENILFTFELARRLEGTGVTVNCLHPGVVKTRLIRDATGFMKFAFGIVSTFFTTPEKGAETSLYVATAPEVEGVTGRYFVKKAPIRPEPFLEDTTLQKALWAASEKLV